MNKFKKYIVYVPVKEFWVVEVMAPSKKEAIAKCKIGGDSSMAQIHSLSYKESPNGKFSYQAYEDKKHA